MKKTLSITVISKACGISAPTLRIWEKRYNAFSPGRDEAGQRLYSEDDLARAKLLVALIDRGFSISNIVNLNTTELHERLENGRVDARLPCTLEHTLRNSLAALKNLTLRQWPMKCNFSA